MLMYLLALCLVGWLASRLIVSHVPKWWMTIIASAVSFAAVFAVGFLIMAVEVGQVGAGNAVRRFAGALLPALIACIWSAVATYRQKRSGRAREEVAPPVTKG